jgi:hypothetical protein
MFNIHQLVVSHMATTQPISGDLPVREVTILSVILAVLVFYVFIYGGPMASLGLLALYIIGAGIGLFTLYLFYRFVIAVETIAETH